MDKLLDYSSEDSVRKSLYPIRTAGGSLIKHAAASEWPPEVLDFISKLVPEDNMHYSLCNALGAGEYWSSNVNGDYFERDELISNHGSFLNGTPFMHHINKDPTKGYGRILFSAYNPRMNRVELVVEHDTTKLPKDIVKKLENDELVNLSMGCRVPFDVCSICGNKAPSPKDYCTHVTKTGLNFVFPDGRKVYLLNPNPDFFDISIVIVPADKTACILAKIFGAKKTASAVDPMRGFRSLVTPSAFRAEMAKTASTALSLIDTFENRPMALLRDIALRTKTAAGLCESIKSSRAYFRPNEMQAMLFVQSGLEKLAKAVLDNNVYFECKTCVLTELGEPGNKIKLASLDAHNMAVRAAIGSSLANNELNGVSVEDDLSGLGGIITPELLKEISRASMLSFLIGKALSSDSMTLLPLLSAGTHIAANALTSDNDNMADIMAQKAMARDLYIEPLIRAKKASADLTLKQLYSIPLGVI